MAVRRILAVYALAALLLGATLFALPRAAFDASVQEALESSSTAAPSAISSAVDAGAAAALAGVLPTSEPYQRGQAIVSGLKAGIPSSPPSLSSAQLDVVTAMARGMVAAAVTDAPALSLSQGARDALSSISTGEMQGYLASVPPSPNAGASALAQSVSAGVVDGAIAALTAGSPAASSSSLLDGWAREQATSSFAFVAAQGSALTGIVGSPALTDVESFVAAAVQGQLSVFPFSASQQQVDAFGAFLGGEVVGLVAGDLATFPQGAPTPLADELRAWAGGMGAGLQGSPPWDLASDGALDALSNWAQAVAQSSFAAVQQGPDITPTQTTLDALRAWAQGLAQGGFADFPADPGQPPDVQADVQAYAEGLVAPGIAFLSTAPHPMDPDGLRAYAASLVNGADTLRGTALDSTVLLQRYLKNVAAAALNIPPDVTPEQVKVLEAFGKAVTDRISQRLDSIQGAVVGGVDPGLLDAMEQGLVAGLGDIMNASTGGGDTSLFGALVSGLTTGFLESKDPSAVWTDAQGATDATQVWFENVIPSSFFGPLLRTTAGTGTNASAAIHDFGKTFGEAPVEWVAQDGQVFTDEGFGTVGDLMWIAELSKTSATIVPPLILQGDLPPGYVDEVDHYAAGVFQSATDITIKQALVSVDIGKLQAAAKAYAETVLSPVEWLTPHYVKDEAAAAREALNETLDHAARIRDFADAGYAGAVKGYVKAIGDGAKGAEAIAAAQPARAKAQAKLTSAWVKGVLGPVLDAPAGQVVKDLQSRKAWLAASPQSAITSASNGTQDQRQATKQYAHDVMQWVLAAGEGPLPNVTHLGFPLVPWANASVQKALESMPPTMSQDEIDAYTAYASGIAEAIVDVPTPDVVAWTGPQVLALTTYVGDLSAGATTVIADLQALDDALACKYAGMSCPETPCDPETQDCGSGEPAPEPEPEPSDPCSLKAAPDCYASEQANATARYVDNVHAWANSATTAVLDAMPDTTPTTNGILVVHKWATDVLGDHGIVVSTSDPLSAWQGPRGPAYDFASARLSDVQAFGNETGIAYSSLIDIGSLNATSFAQNATPIADPLIAWLSALQAASAGYFLDHAHAPATPEAGEAPSLPPAPKDPSLDAGQAWLDAMFGAIPGAYRSLFDMTPAPDLNFLGGFGDQLDYLALSLIAHGGAEAAFRSADAIYAQGGKVTPQTGPLDAFAQGLIDGAVTNANGTLLSPAQHDSEALLAYYTGLAQGGAGAITSFAGAVKDQQIPAIQAFAAVLADASWLPPPPVPEAIQDLQVPDPTQSSGDSGDGGSGDGGNSTNDTQGSDVDPQTQAMQNLQADAAGLAARALAAPIAPGAAAYPTIILAYVTGVRDAAANMPPLSADAGYPARLRAWVDAETYGALSKPPTTDLAYYAPSPDVAMGVAYAQAFAGASAWTLVDSKTADVQAALAFATAAVGAAQGMTCPADASIGSCAAAASAAGAALGLLPPVNFAVRPDVPSLDLGVAAIAQGVAEGLVAPPGVPVDPTTAASIAQGIVAGLVPAGLTDPDAGAIADATAAAVLAYAPEIPDAGVEPTAAAIASGLLASANATAASAPALATGAAAYVASKLQAGEAPDPVILQGFVSAFLGTTPASGDAKPSPAIEVTGAKARLTSGDLDGSRVLSGLNAVTFHVIPPVSEPAPIDWSVSWSTSDPAAAGAHHLALTPTPGGGYGGSVSAADLRALASPMVKFIVEASSSGSPPVVFDRDGAPFAFKVDRDLPTVTVTSPATAAGAFKVAWTGKDDESGIASYHVEVQDNGGAFKDVFAETRDTTISFTGAIGHTYAFRVTATDVAGQTGPASALARTTVTGAAASGPNKAPTLSFLSPTAGATYDGAIPVQLKLADPDGSSPMVKVCVRRAGDETDLACPYEGSSASFALDVGDLPDGRLQLHAVATDGSLTTDAVSPTFTLARAAPSFLGAAASLTAGQPGLVTAALTGSPTSVTARVLDKGGASVATRELHDDGSDGDQRAHDGVWSTTVTLAAGDYQVAFQAKDANDHVAELTKSVTARVPPPKPTSGGGHGAAGNGTSPTPTTPTSGTPAPAGKKSFLPGPELGLIALAICLIAVALRRKR